MSRGLSEAAIIKALADATANRITRRIIASLQRMHDTLYVYAEAGCWSNQRIRAYIDRSSIRD